MSYISVKIKDSVGVIGKLVASTTLVLSLTSNPGLSVKVDSLIGSAPFEYAAPLTTDAQEPLIDDTQTFYLTWE